MEGYRATTRSKAEERNNGHILARLLRRFVVRDDSIDVRSNKAGGGQVKLGGGKLVVDEAAATIEFALPTEALKVKDAGSAGATEQDWIEVEVGGVTGYIRVHATK